MSLKSFENKVKRNGFDLSFKNAFTAKAGELLPVFCKEVLPGDKFNIRGQAFTRTQPVMSAAYVRLREYYDFFFVPYKLLWNRFPTFFTQLPDYHQASDVNTSVSVGDQHPYFTKFDIQKYFNKFNSDDTNKNNLFGYNRALLTCKLLDFLGYGDFSSMTGSMANDMVMNPMPLLAYQKVCQDFFRDDQWEQAAPYKYNVDYLVNSSDVHIPVSSIALDSYNMFDLNYCNYSKDYFMGMLPSSQFGDESFAPLSGSSGLITDLVVTGSSSSGNPNWGATSATLYGDMGLSSKNTGKLSVMSKGTSPGGGNEFLSAGLSIPSTSGLSILALRQAEALQKWKEIAQSGRQDYQTQMQKHFNVSPSDAMSNHCKYLGGWTSNVDINEVLNTNLDAEASQADIKGKGVGTSQGNIEFDAKEHGILIGLYHCLPLLDYNINGVSKLNMKSHATDYAIPEFDSIGMQEVPFEELIDGLGAAADLTLGYVPRYADYKTSVDVVHGAFNKSLEYWVSPLTTEYLRAYFDAVEAKYGSARITYEFFKVNPSILDNLFGVNADSSVDTDQFLVNSFFDTKAVRNLDYNGLPY